MYKFSPALGQLEFLDMSNYCTAYSHGLNAVCDPFFIKHTHTCMHTSKEVG